MPQNPPAGYGWITPYLLYHDTDAAVDFLTSAFGFEERFRMAGPNGKSMHAEIEIAEGVLMLGTPGSDFESPNELGGRTQTTYVYVDDVDAHFEHAKAAGAEITRELEDQFYGDRTYTAQDPEGHSWSFATHVREVAPEDMQAAMLEAAAG